MPYFRSIMSKHKEFIIKNKPNGFSLEPMALRLLEAEAGLGKWDEQVIDDLRAEIFQRTDGVCFFADQIADDKTQRAIDDLADDWINTFGCFSLDALRVRFESRILHVSDDTTDFECFLNMYEGYKIVSYGKTRLVRDHEVSKQEALEKMSFHIEMCLDTDGSSEIQLLERIPALDAGLLSDIVKECLQRVAKLDVDGVVWYCKQASVFPDDLCASIFQSVQQLEDLDLPVDINSLSILLSLRYQTNFRKTYQIADDKQFRTMVSTAFDVVRFGLLQSDQDSVISTCERIEERKWRGREFLILSSK